MTTIITKGTGTMAGATADITTVTGMAITVNGTAINSLIIMAGPRPITHMDMRHRRFTIPRFRRRVST